MIKKISGKDSRGGTMKGLGRVMLGAAVLVGLVILGLSLVSGTAAAGEKTPPNGMATYTPTPTDDAGPTPTATVPAGARIFVGEIAMVDDTCGTGSITLVLDPDGTQVESLVVVDFIVASSPNSQTTVFDPPAAIDPDDGTFANSGPLPPPLDSINAAISGTFDFDADPATVSGMLTISLAADTSNVLCEAGFTAEELAAGAPTPTVPPPEATATTAAAGPTATVAALPSTGIGPSSDSGNGAALWAALAAVVGAAALAGGLVVLRRRSV